MEIIIVLLIGAVIRHFWRTYDERKYPPVHDIEANASRLSVDAHDPDGDEDDEGGVSPYSGCRPTKRRTPWERDPTMPGIYDKWYVNGRRRRYH